MAWKEVSAKQLAQQLGIDYAEVKAKHELINRIKDARESLGLTQQAVAEKVGKSQGYLARIERGVGTKNISFDVLLRILNKLGYNYTIVVKQTSKRRSLAA